MKKQNQKLRISKATLHNLGHDQQHALNGGALPTKINICSAIDRCPTRLPSCNPLICTI
jgi:hypothetical protein